MIRARSLHKEIKLNISYEMQNNINNNKKI